MIQCDNRKYNQWFHYGCVNVTESIATRKWKCDKCSTNPSDISIKITEYVETAQTSSSYYEKQVRESVTKSSKSIVSYRT